MLLQHEKDDAYFNFVNSINSDATRKNYEYCLSRFLKYCNLDLDSLLKLATTRIIESSLLMICLDVYSLISQNAPVLQCLQGGKISPAVICILFSFSVG